MACASWPASQRPRPNLDPVRRGLHGPSLRITEAVRGPQGDNLRLRPLETRCGALAGLVAGADRILLSETPTAEAASFGVRKLHHPWPGARRVSRRRLMPQREGNRLVKGQSSL